MTNYPPGVTGNEYAINGPDYEVETHEACPKCGFSLLEQGYYFERWVVCTNCDYTEDREPAWCCDAGPMGHSGRHWNEDTERIERDYRDE